MITFSDGKHILFLWADSEDKLYKILTEKDCKDITILKSTNEEWTPEWVNSESDVEEKEIEKDEGESFLVTKELVQNKLKKLSELVEKTEPEEEYVELWLTLFFHYKRHQMDFYIQ